MIIFIIAFVIDYELLLKTPLSSVTSCRRTLTTDLWLDFSVVVWWMW